MNDYLKFMGPCPICNSRFNEADIETVSQAGNVSLFHADCVSCKSSVFMTLVKGEAGMVTNVGILTDLTKKDFRDFNNSKVITVEDVLELHEALKKK